MFHFDILTFTPKILVVGDLMIDHYIWGACERISPEAPVAIVEVQQENNTLGGACNVVHNLLALGAQVFPCGVIGGDRAGVEVQEKLQQLGIDTQGLIIEKDRPTTQKSRILASNQQVLRVDWEQKQDINLETQNILLEFIVKKMPDVDVVILSDYAKGVLTTTLTQKIIAKAREYQKYILVDPKGKDYSKYDHATLLTPNKKEAYEATGIKIIDSSTLTQCLHALKQQCHLTYPLITLSEDGIGLLQNDQLKKIPTISREVYDVTGAGDTVIASLAFGLAVGLSIEKAAEFANAAAAVVVSKIGSATASLQEIQCYYAFNQISSNQKIVSIAQMAHLVQVFKKQGKTIVWTNGCFDILHYGHTQYLEEAKKLGDILIVGVNSDESITKLKGKDRPINPLQDRVGVLSALWAVDYIVSFDDLTPYHVISQISPDILVKGGDYAGKEEEIVGKEFAKEVRTLLLLPGRSSTQVIEKIKKL